MSEHRASVSWTLGQVQFTYDSYSRDHVWRFDGGVEVRASAAKEYLGNPDLVDPEEAFVASLASCHMLTFLAVAARRRLHVDRYEDSAVGFMEKNASGKLAITRVVLHPRISFGEGRSPSRQELERLHDLAHRECFIANSVNTEVSVESD
jgi:organic hydroperoxide reductase OsmC/OhrA